ncbi:MAG: 30S ribosome-binding factor RbfA [Fermentimonas sp.]|jgi:ribosome-binding factor A|nr:30S ribosome-binding factor RbfA [Fermentimonas sp.]MDD4010305.1 30S ribosome-binding factor RbfA [Fermentimonas sp.]MDD4697256.1 30S ribosome-binding factor RbfA [Fermentimonas sp.]
MDSNRQQKINRLIQKELGELFLLETKKMPGILISVTNVRVSPDLSIAHAYLSVFPSEKGAELVKNINENVKSVRFNLGKRLKNQLRVIPELTFHIDDSLDYVENIDRLLKND